MTIINLGILAHVDAGKTTLTERLLYAAGVIDSIGSVDRGTTQTDTLPLEQQRGITIKTGVVSFAIGEVTVNLIDTPGHPDFIAEVERALRVLDGAVLVVSAVEGVQAQTRVLMRALQRLHIPTLLFVNKIDRAGAEHDRVLQEIASKLTPAIVPMGSTTLPGTRQAQFQPFDAGDAGFLASLAEVLADHDEALLARYLDDDAQISCSALHRALTAQTGAALVHPVFFGSAITGAGVEALMAGIEELFPAVATDSGGPPVGTVFKVERGAAGVKVAYVRMVSGTLRVRDRLYLGGGRDGKVTALSVFRRGPAVPATCLGAGEIGKLWGLADARIGDRIGPVCELSQPDNGEFQDNENSTNGYFAPPTLETAVVPCRATDASRLHDALEQLAEVDPLIGLRQDDRRGEMYLSLYGEVQKEVIAATLAEEYNLDVHFRETSVICIERPLGIGEAVDRMGKGGNPFLATVGLRIEPAPLGSGIEFRLEAELVTVPLYIFKSVEEFRAAMAHTVRTTLAAGLYGWQVTDCLVTMTESGYASPSSSARDFRLLTPVVLMSALQTAGTAVHEPVHRFHLEIPADTYGATAAALAQLGAALQSTTTRGPAYLLAGDVLAARIQELRQRLPALTRGEGVLECEFAGYRAIGDPVPTRPRSDHNPLDRKEYLLHVVRRV